MVTTAAMSTLTKPANVVLNQCTTDGLEFNQTYDNLCVNFFIYIYIYTMSQHKTRTGLCGILSSVRSYTIRSPTALVLGTVSLALKHHFALKNRFRSLVMIETENCVSLRINHKNAHCNAPNLQ